MTCHSLDKVFPGAIPSDFQAGTEQTLTILLDEGNIMKIILLIKMLSLLTVSGGS